MRRVYSNFLSEFLNKKIILLTGPRQSGKTTLSKMISKNHYYLNYDNETDKDVIESQAWDRKKKIVIFVELHKKKQWKQWLKGIYDTTTIPPGMVVTGSARLDTYKKPGDSLAGRYFQYRLHPLDIRELYQLNNNINIDNSIERLLKFSGFPEPYLENKKSFYNRWRKTHLDIILKQDLVSLEDIRDIQAIENLIELMRSKIGNPVSYSNLAKQLQRSDKTIKHWLTILENMYVLFKVQPYHKKISRSVLKQPKYYFYDNARVIEQGPRLENLVANSLFKECHFREDCLGEIWNLHYLRKSTGEEVDFLITKDEQPYCMIEVKTTDTIRSKTMGKFKKELTDNVQQIQLVKNIEREYSYPDGYEIRKLGTWLAQWN